ncbi:MAG: cell division FtsA domain-containing protein, partial [Gemmatimonadota bacterium]|nr:cell division FtsA domain-containing protein [Gemmatimonadota bacterium]
LDDFVMSPLASGLAVLRDDERESGVALIDLGGSSTDVLAWTGRRLAHAATLPWGGATVTRDIARGLGVPADEAERLKLRWGSARRSAVDPKEQLELSGSGNGSGRRVSRELLAHIIEQRLDEILGLVYEELEEADVLDRMSGIVLTGGTGRLPEITDLARSVFNLPVRIGRPGAGLAGATDAVATPAHATAVGLVQYGATRHRTGGWGEAGRALARVGGWLRNFF